MIVIACLDDNGGMMFNHRRQSQDRVLRAHIAALVGDARLWMNHYSAQQFDAESIQHLNVDDAFLQEAVDGDYCFVEDTALKSYERWIEKIIVFRWNRAYPTCSSVNDMKEKNKQEFFGTRDETIALGYSPCGRCKP